VHLQILFVEDSDDDAELMRRRLRDAGLEVRWDRVDTETGLAAALASAAWDVALVDFNLPGFGGPQALATMARLAPDVPAITVSGAIDEDTAVATLTGGAVDYVLKDNLARLAPAVRRAVEGAELRRQHRTAEERASLALYVTDHSPVGSVTLAEDGTIVAANPAYAALRGVPQDTLVGQLLWQGNLSLSVDWWADVKGRVRRSGRYEAETEMTRLDGDRRVVDVLISEVEYRDERYFVGWVRDVTERRRAEEALETEEANLAAIFEASPVAMLVLDRDLNVVRVNQATVALTEGCGEALLDYDVGSREQCGSVLACVHDEEDPRGCGYSASCPLCPLRNGLEGMIAGGAAVRGAELALDVRCDGQVRRQWLRVGAEPVALNGSPHFVVALDDVTETKRAEQALRESEHRFADFADNAPAEMWIATRDQECVYANAQLARDVGREAAELVGMRLPDLWGETGEQLRTKPLYDAAARGEVCDDLSSWPMNGAERWFRSVFFPVGGDEGPSLVGGFSLDITDEHEAQAEVLRHAERLRRTVEGAVLAMGHVVETRDPYTAGHERRVAELAVALARELGLEPERLEGLRLAALIHDIGKIAVPAEILAKPGRLSEVEFNLIRQHARAGYEILAAIEFDAPVAEIVLQHHERLSGSGYPAGLAGDEILFEARILAVADVVEAMSSHRPYRPALGMARALEEVRRGAGTDYDPEVAAACLQAVEGGFAFSP
jgi:PAS domain S-box-containing protein/putative nucleotidyltransferase with HDIG domain